MVPRAEYLRFALSLQESADESPAKLKAALEAALTHCASVDPWKAHLQEAGARHSASDMQHLQGIHDAAAVLGASCGTREAAAPPADSPLKLVESAANFAVEVPLTEAVRSSYPIKIIDAGTGSTAHYPADALKREAAKFKPGILMFWNHATAAEESQRPEGNLDHLAAITTSQGVWKDDGPKGPGIYAEAKVMSDYAERVQERAPHIGLSIRAGGIREGTKVIDGKPVLKEFTHIESVDYVTKAGRGGLALAEAARDAGLLPKESDMDAEELKALKEAQVALAADNKRLLERATRADARELAASVLAPLSLVEASKARVINDVLSHELPMKDGTLDAAKFTEAVNASAKAEGAYVASLLGSGQIRGMGAGAPQPVAETPEQINAREAAQVRTQKNRVNIYADLMGGNIKAAEAAVDYKGAA